MSAGEKQQVEKAIEELGQQLKEDVKENINDTSINELKELQKKLRKGVDNKTEKTIKDAMGLSDSMVEGMYGNAYRLYNTGKYKEAIYMFRLLVVLNPNEPKYSLGLAACYHMMKDYNGAVDTYMLCSVLDPKSPIPHYHASDCYLQMNDKVSAVIALDLAVKRSGEKPEFKTLKDRAVLTIESLKNDLSNPKDV